MNRLVAVGILCGLVVGVGRGAVAAPTDAGGRVDVNSASVEELERLPGIGPSLARAIVDRRAQGPFRRPEDLREVKGIGDRLYDKLKDQITVGDAAPPEGRGQ